MRSMTRRIFRLLAASGVFLPLIAHGYEPGTVAQGGVIKGKVTFQGVVPAARRIPISKDTGVCGTGTREIVEVAAANGALQHAVVYVAKVDKGKAWGVLSKPLLDQSGCRFVPTTIVLQKGADLTIRNSDPVLHNIHTYEIIGTVRRTIFNIGQPDKGDIKQTVRLRRSNIVKLECDAHDFMHGWAFAVENPYVASTGADGSFAIDGVPPGTYELKSWHPVLGEKTATVTVKAGGTAEASFRYSR